MNAKTPNPATNLASQAPPHPPPEPALEKNPSVEGRHTRSFTVLADDDDDDGDDDDSVTDQLTEPDQESDGDLSSVSEIDPKQAALAKLIDDELALMRRLCGDPRALVEVKHIDLEAVLQMDA